MKKGVITRKLYEQQLLDSWCWIGSIIIKIDTCKVFSQPVGIIMNVYACINLPFIVIDFYDVYWRRILFVCVDIRVYRLPERIFYLGLYRKANMSILHAYGSVSQVEYFVRKKYSRLFIDAHLCLYLCNQRKEICKSKSPS